MAKLLIKIGERAYFNFFVTAPQKARPVHKY